MKAAVSEGEIKKIFNLYNNAKSSEEQDRIIECFTITEDEKILKKIFKFTRTLNKQKKNFIAKSISEKSYKGRSLLWLEYKKDFKDDLSDELKYKFFEMLSIKNFSIKKAKDVKKFFSGKKIKSDLRIKVNECVEMAFLKHNWVNRNMKNMECFFTA